MQRETDEEILYNALVRYQECCGNKKMPVLSVGKVITLRGQLLQQVEKYMLFINSSKTSSVEIQALCNKGKKLYQNYCFQLKVNPEVDTTRLAQKMDELVHFIASYEAERFGQIREREAWGDKIDLEQLFVDDKNIRILICKPIDIAVSEIFKSKKYTVVGEDNITVYMTVSGSRYHIKDCPYCRGKSLIKTSLLKVENIGLKPCKCIEKEMLSVVRENSASETINDDKLNEQPEDMSNKSVEGIAEPHVGENLLEKNEFEVVQEEERKVPICVVKRPASKRKYVTAYVDESVRVNPWQSMDESIPKWQGLYSYIICDGMLTSESLITQENTMFTGVETSEEIRRTGEVAIEAIMAVLFRLVKVGYQENVLIYTDNMEAKDYWYKSAASKNLSKLFTSVMVCYIPREANRKADQLGRDRAIMDLPAETMVRVMGRCKGYFALKAEMDFVKSYFPVPKKNIPNLMTELKALARVGEGSD